MLSGVFATARDFTIVLFQTPSRVCRGSDVTYAGSWTAFEQTGLLALDDVDPPHSHLTFYRRALHRMKDV